MDRQIDLHTKILKNLVNLSLNNVVVVRMRGVSFILSIKTRLGVQFLSCLPFLSSPPPPPWRSGCPLVRGNYFVKTFAKCDFLIKVLGPFEVAAKILHIKGAARTAAAPTNEAKSTSRYMERNSSPPSSPFHWVRGPSTAAAAGEEERQHHQRIGREGMALPLA